MRPERVALAATLVCLAAGANAAAQRITVSGGLARQEYRLRADTVSERFSGLAGDFSATAGLGPAELTVRSVVGTLNADTAALNSFDRQLGQLDLITSVWFEGRFAAQLGVTFRSHSTVIGHQRWTIIRTGLEARLPFADQPVTGILRWAYFPHVAVKGLPQPNVAFTAEAGLEYRLPFASGRVLYRLERFDFPAQAGPSREEQLSEVRVEAVLLLHQRE